MTQLLVIGLSHKTAPVSQREKASLSDNAARGLMADLLASDHIAEAVAVSTCNRTEVYVAADRLTQAEAVIRHALVAHTHMNDDDLACAGYVLTAEDAAVQLFRVAASLDSMVVGESEIQGQVRAAWERARETGASGPILNQLCRRALEVGKRVRSETAIAKGAVSVASVAVDLAREALPDLPAERVLVIGAGSVAEATMAALVERGVSGVTVANRTVSTARDLAARVGGQGVGFDRLPQELAAAGIVISSTDAPHAVLDRAAIESALADRGSQPMVMIDISVPRDLDPAIGDLPGVSLYDIDDLERVVSTNLNGRRAEIHRAERIVAGAIADFASWQAELAATPTIARLRAKAETIRRAELERMEPRWDALSDDDRERLDALTKGIINKLLHEPTVRVRDAAGNGGGAAYLESLRDLFGLRGEES